MWCWSKHYRGWWGDFWWVFTLYFGKSKRAQSRNKFQEATTLEQFIQDEQNENSGYHIQRVFDCMELADYKIENDSTLEELYHKIDKIIK